MKRGTLKYRAEFERPDRVPDGYGGFEDRWIAEFGRLAALRAVNPAKGDERTTESGEMQVMGHMLTVRDDSDTRRIASNWRVTVMGRTMAVRGVGFPMNGEIRISVQEGAAQ
ncbi:head-tail adaptor protein [Mangrovicoccus sp. HB161399]|uniref:phage head completion protein n=1 Tax=Mangrovicoccus sp. HB161399 TaxID=2720392 RepID=UPI001556EBDB|nr:head-tail adaptor protein [Mangrovicoccus sp. HB161399]